MQRNIMPQRGVPRLRPTTTPRLRPQCHETLNRDYNKPACRSWAAARSNQSYRSEQTSSRASSAYTRQLRRLASILQDRALGQRRRVVQLSQQQQEQRREQLSHQQQEHSQSDRQVLGGVQPYCACQDAWCNTNYKSGGCNAICVDRLRPRQGNSRGMDSPAQAQAIIQLIVNGAAGATSHHIIKRRQLRRQAPHIPIHCL